MTGELEKKYAAKVLLVSLLYLAVTYVSVWSLKNFELAGFRTIISVTPMIPMAAVVMVILSHVRRMDEFERRVQLEACVFSIIVTGMVTGTWGFMENVGYPVLGIEWVLPMLMISWGLGSLIAKRRYLK
jgi:hypothetical protein